MFPAMYEHLTYLTYIICILFYIIKKVNISMYTMEKLYIWKIYNVSFDIWGMMQINLSKCFNRTICKANKKGLSYKKVCSCVLCVVLIWIEIMTHLNY